MCVNYELKRQTINASKLAPLIVLNISNNTAYASEDLFILICSGGVWTQISGTTSRHAPNWATLACLKREEFEKNWFCFFDLFLVLYCICPLFHLPFIALLHSFFMYIPALFYNQFLGSPWNRLRTSSRSSKINFKLVLLMRLIKWLN